MREQKEELWFGIGLLKEFPVNFGLRQGRALSPLMCIMVVELISRKISTGGVLVEMMIADDLAIMAENKQKLQCRRKGRGFSRSTD